VKKHLLRDFVADVLQQTITNARFKTKNRRGITELWPERYCLALWKVEFTTTN